MYPSMNNNGCMQDYYNENDYSKTPQQCYNTPSSTSFFLPSPTYIPLEDEAVFCEFFQQQQFFSNDDHNHHNTVILEHEMMPNVESTIEEYSNNNGHVANHCEFNTHLEPENSSRRKRIFKRDRHSKINTARGPRDRRMRLSLDVARKLFGLQDLLGFDKASKTVDWLLTKSKRAILDLLPDRTCSFMGVSNSASSTSECEVLSGTADQVIVKPVDDQSTTKIKANSSSGGGKRPKEKVTRVRKYVDFHHPLAKATRERARERARERTVAKKNNKHVVDQDSKFRPYLHQAMDQDLNPLGSWSTLQENQHQSIGHMISSNLQFNQGFVGDNSSMLLTGNWTPSYILDYPNSPRLTHEHQVSDLQMNVKEWERAIN